MSECMERNSSVQNGFKIYCKREAYPYVRGTVPNSRVNAAYIRTLFCEDRVYKSIEALHL